MSTNIEMQNVSRSAANRSPTNAGGKDLLTTPQKLGPGSQSQAELKIDETTTQKKKKVKKPLGEGEEFVDYKFYPREDGT